ncbi:uncharacterized protein VP01_2029g1 [Puccinia sorghi]|uniref:Uncharacterized protein n=1 Tax=Puccinia sorghi TaxID=27349 RepID=A0A0L6VBP1_9BASI|nr:uncharacterized protein VP01_2029g1 [Puccinia sorghi]
MTGDNRLEQPDDKDWYIQEEIYKECEQKTSFKSELSGSEIGPLGNQTGLSQPKKQMWWLTSSQGYSTADCTALVTGVKKILPLGNQEWGNVHDICNQYATKNNYMAQEIDSLNMKFCDLVDAKKPPGKSVCPPWIWEAKLVDLLNCKMAVSNAMVRKGNPPDYGWSSTATGPTQSQVMSIAKSSMSLGCVPSLQAFSANSGLSNSALLADCRTSLASHNVPPPGPINDHQMTSDIATELN